MSLPKFFSKKLKTPQYNQIDLEKKLIASLAKSRIPNLRQVKYLHKLLNPKEWHWLYAGIFITVFGVITLSYQFFSQHLISNPKEGGSYIEGLVGAPDNINPLYADLNDIDADLSSILFSSLFKHNNTGEIIPDLVANYTADEDQKSYTLKIKNNIKWSNGSLLTSDDIIFTFNSILDKQYNSPLRQTFAGTTIEKIDDTTIKFTLLEPYSLFLELLTFGILPSAAWENINPQAISLAKLNLEPISSGPYQFSSLSRDKNGNIHSYTLERNPNYYNQKPLIDNLIFKFFPNSEEAIAAFNNGQIDGLNYLPPELEKTLITKNVNNYQLKIPQATGLFFNLSNEAITSQNYIRRALALSVNPQALTKFINNPKIALMDGPIFTDSWAYTQNSENSFQPQEALKLLEKNNWEWKEITATDIQDANTKLTSEDEKTRLAAQEIISLGLGKWRYKKGQYFILKITIPENQNLLALAQFLSDNWKDYGIKTNIEIVSLEDFGKNVIQTRNYSILLYNQLSSFEPEPYSAWHSSQINQAGYNLSNYTNKDVDKLLEDARFITDKKIRQEKYAKFQELFRADIPAIFLTNSTYQYLQSQKVKGFATEKITKPADRFNNIVNWYVKTKTILD